MIGDENVALRRAALYVHGMNAKERGQLLIRLNEADAARLRPLLAELGELGVPRSLGRKFADAPVSIGRDSARSEIEAQVCALEADDVARVISRCPAGIAARFVGGSSWPWREEVLRKLPASHRSELHTFAGEGGWPLAPAVKAAICERLLREVTPAIPRRRDPRLEFGSRVTTVAERAVSAVKGWFAWTH